MSHTIPLPEEGIPEEDSGLRSWSHSYHVPPEGKEVKGFSSCLPLVEVCPQGCGFHWYTNVRQRHPSKVLAHSPREVRERLLTHPQQHKCTQRLRPASYSGRLWRRGAVWDSPDHQGEKRAEAASNLYPSMWCSGRYVSPVTQIYTLAGSQAQEVLMAPYLLFGRCPGRKRSKRKAP